MADRPLTDWNFGLCACCEDINTCCFGFWCCPCLACTVSGNFGETKCLPLWDFLTPAVFASFGIPCFAPPAALSLRSAIRHRYNIKGSLCKDIAISCVCAWCSWCQMHREVKERRRSPTVLTVNTPNYVTAPNYVTTQPPSVVVIR